MRGGRFFWFPFKTNEQGQPLKKLKLMFKAMGMGLWRSTCSLSAHEFLVDHSASPELASLFLPLAFLGSLCFPLTRQKGDICFFAGVLSPG